MREDCEIRRILERVADRWTLLVLALLDEEGRLRFSELRRQADGISQRMLSVTLRQLERDGMVERTAYPEVPPRVEYEITALGRSLRGMAELMVTWTEAHEDEIARARAAYDGRAAVVG